MTQPSSHYPAQSMIALSSRILRSRRLCAGVSALAVAALSSCSTSEILKADNPGIIDIANATVPAAATFLRNGAIQTFVTAFDGGDAFVVATGNLTDELRASDTFDGRLLPNKRFMNDNLPEVTSTYVSMHKARTDLGTAAKTLLVVAPTQKFLAGEMFMYRGFMEDFFGEMYCSGVPFSSVDDGGNFVYGMPQTTTQIFTRAVATIDSALALADTSKRVQFGAAVAKGRALLNLGQYAAAATAVAAVPTTFKLVVDHCNCTGGTENGVYNSAAAANSRYTPSKNEGVNGLDFQPTVADPRLPWIASTRSGFSSIWRNMPVPLKVCPVYRGGSCSTSPNTTGQNVLADGIEARLIEAEARLQGGTQADRDAVFATLNTLRQTGITPVVPVIAGTAPTTQAAAVTQLFNERAYWMYLTGHRLGDMRRLIRQYGRDAETVFPTGEQAAPISGPYGTDVNFYIPASEKNNPNFTGCLDRKA